MPISPDARPLPNSEMPPLPGSRVVGQTDPASRFTITIALRPRRGAPPLPDARHFMRVPPGRRLFFTPALLAEHFGASPEDAAALRRHLEAQGLVVEAIDLAARNVRASGTVRQMSDTFGITFHEFERPLPHPRRRPDGRLKRREPTVQIYRGYTGAVLLPGDIVDAVQAVFGLSNVRLGGSNMPPPVGFIVDPMNVIRVAEIYRFPGFPTLDASGQSVAILMINGSTDETPVRESVNDYFTTWVPTFTNGSFFSFDSTSKLTFHRDGPTIAGSDPETVLDVCVAATVAQKASITVYQRVDTVSQSTAWLDALDRLIADNPPTIAISVFLGGDDSQLDPGILATLSGKLQALAALGATVFVAAGDTGSAAESPPLSNNAAVQYPASDPWVTSCGGTTLGHDGAGTAEIVWNHSSPGGGATGGGVSRVFPCPPWQIDAGLAPVAAGSTIVRRGLPDVAGQASDENPYFFTQVHGFNELGDGTSAVPPLYAGLVAILNRALGYRIGFLNPTLYEHAAEVRREVTAGNNHWQSTAVPFYTAGAGWDACTGWGSLDGQKLLATLQKVAAPPVQSIRIVVDHTTFSRPAAVPAAFPGALFVILEGFSASALGLNATASPATNAGLGPAIASNPAVGDMTITPTLVDWNPALPSAQAQTITFTYRVRFNSVNPFPAAGASTLLMLSTNQGAFSDTAPIELVTTPEPYFSNGATSWLSADLRVFKMNAGDAVMMGRFQAPDPATSPTAFIQTAIQNLRNGTVDFTAFDSLPQNEQVSALELLPAPNGVAVYNFALARVRYRAGAAGAASNVRVFFRLFPTMSTGTVYTDPSETSGDYRTFSDGVVGGRKIPLLGIESGHYTTVPYFAEARYSPSRPMTDQTDNANVTRIEPGPTGDTEVVSYFGCWLDFNQDTPRFPTTLPPAGQEDGAFNTFTLHSIRDMMAGAHQCLVAEIAFDGDAIPAGASPGTSARLAQRNIAWVPGENPGADGESRRAPHTFEIRGATRDAGCHEPDELMIDFSHLPPNTLARIYTPTIPADEILSLAARHYATPALFRYDDHTVYCEARGVVFMPVPQRRESRHPALLSVDLPASIRKGQVFRVVVRQLTSSTAGPFEGRVRRPPRRVLGSFQLEIPVDKRHVLLPREEQTLLALRQMSRRGIPHDPWHAVLARCVEEHEGRVRGLGGDPDAIRPRPSPHQRQD